MNDINILNDRLEKIELTAVQFIMDYLQLHFQDKGFTFYIWPIVEIHQKKFVYGDTQYRDKLCDIIGQKVNKIFIYEDMLIIDFKYSKIICNLDIKNTNIISEICIFQDKDDWWIW